MNEVGLLNSNLEPGDEKQKREKGRENLLQAERERPALLQLSARYGPHEAAQPYRKQPAQGKGKGKQGQWHEEGEVGGGQMERIRGGGVNGVHGFVCQVVFCGGSSQISAFSQQIKIAA